MERELIFETCFIQKCTILPLIIPHQPLIPSSRIMNVSFIILAFLGFATAVSGLCTITPVNVGGHKYEVHKSLFTGEHSESHLTSMLRESNCADHVYIDTNPNNFSHVLDFLRYGKSVLPLSGKN